MERVTFGSKVASSSSSSTTEEEVLGPQIKTEAELTLQYLLDKQLATSGRLEVVEFKEATEDLCELGHACAGVTTLADFRRQNHELKADESLSRSEEAKGKRRRYGANPAFLQSLHLESTSAFKKQSTESSSQVIQQKMGRHAKELEASLLRGKGRLKAIAHLSEDGISCRKPLLGIIEQSELCKGTTPDERARANSGAVLRTSGEVFASPPPAVLNLHTYMEEKKQETMKGVNLKPSASESSINEVGNTFCNPNGFRVPAKLEFLQISEEDVCSNRLSVAEIKEWNSGTFSDYSAGTPSNVLYLKNLSPKVEEADLAALFIRYQRPGEQIIFRLMRHGRMKGQCFVTFPDTERAERALNLINGYKLKERPIIIQYGRSCAQVSGDQ